MDYPKLRYGLEVLPVQHEGQYLIMLRDQLGYAPHPLLLSPALAELVVRMTGEHSLRDLQHHHLQTTGDLVPLEKLTAVVATLNEQLFLENDEFTRRLAEDVERFRQAAVRPMQHAGGGYPAEPDAAGRMLDGFFALAAGGPGPPREGAEQRRLLGVVAPHIDIRAGGVCFAHAYKAVCEAPGPETWFVLGTGHEPVEHFIALTRKDFETPFGVVRCNRELAEALREAAPRDLLASEYNHVREHTVEFQALFLAHLRPAARIVPLLCSFSVEDWEAERAYIDALAQTLGELATTWTEPVGLLASVDLAHIGPRYGDNFRPHAGTIAEQLAADRVLLAALERLDATAFMEALGRDGNQRRICGTAPLYLLALALAGRTEGKLLHHAHAQVDPQSSFVTFASMAFYEKAGEG